MTPNFSGRSNEFESTTTSILKMSLKQQGALFRAILGAFFVLGVLLFFVLLFPLTDPKIYGNQLYVW